MGGVEYTFLGPPGEQGAGILRKTPDMGPMPNVWAVYFEVADPEATCAKAKELGGDVFVGPMDIPVGRMATLADPQGAVFGIMKMTQPAV